MQHFVHNLARKWLAPWAAFAAPAGLGGYCVGVRWVSDQISKRATGAAQAGGALSDGARLPGGRLCRNFSHGFSDESMIPSPDTVTFRPFSMTIFSIVCIGMANALSAFHHIAAHTHIAGLTFYLILLLSPHTSILHTDKTKMMHARRRRRGSLY